ncbi:mediator of RNA polymerase II transcription subunit 33A-like protein [Tanacetum coccineum]
MMNCDFREKRDSNERPALTALLVIILDHLKTALNMLDEGGIVNNTYRPALSSDYDRGSSNSYVSLPVDCTLHLKLPVWENLKAIPFVLDATLTTCAHGRLSPLDLTVDTIADKAQMDKRVDMDRVLSQMVLTDRF